jgi:cytochrome c
VAGAQDQSQAAEILARTNGSSAGSRLRRSRPSLISRNFIMTKFIRALVALFAAVGFVAGAAAQENGTRDEAKSMVEAAVAHIKKAGADKAFEDFTNDKAAWVKKDLYVFVFDLDANWKAHGANAKLVGKNLINLKDQNGKEFVKEFVTVAGGKGEGWVDYDWAHPQTKKVEGKSTLVKRVAGTNLAVGVGVYR